MSATSLKVRPHIRLLEFTQRNLTEPYIGRVSEAAALGHTSHRWACIAHTVHTAVGLGQVALAQGTQEVTPACHPLARWPVPPNHTSTHCIVHEGAHRQHMHHTSYIYSAEMLSSLSLWLTLTMNSNNLPLNRHSLLITDTIHKCVR